MEGGRGKGKRRRREGKGIGEKRKRGESVITSIGRGKVLDKERGRNWMPIRTEVRIGNGGWGK